VRLSGKWKVSYAAILVSEAYHNVNDMKFKNKVDFTIPNSFAVLPHVLALFSHTKEKHCPAFRFPFSRNEFTQETN
jgi:hypothetical protein